MGNDRDPLEDLWNQLLSREPEQVRSAYDRLPLDEQQAVLAHLRRMSEESGWHREQQASARTALEALEGRF